MLQSYLLFAKTGPDYQKFAVCLVVGPEAEPRLSRTPALPRKVNFVAPNHHPIPAPSADIHDICSIYEA